MADMNKYMKCMLEKVTLKLLAMQGVGVEVEQKKEVAAVKKIIYNKKSPCIFDIGANKGEYSLAILEAIPTARIHAFEPSQHAFRKLQTHAEKFVVNQLGVSDSCREAILFSNEAGSPLASLSKRKLDHFDIPFEHTESVKITTLEKYCHENSVRHIDLLKIDAEGEEFNILKGGLSLFESDQISSVQFEFGGCNIDSKTHFMDFYYFFKKYNFMLFRILSNSALYSIESYKELYEIPIYQNFIAIKSSHAINT